MKQKEIEILINLLKKINNENFGPDDCKGNLFCLLCSEVMCKMSVAIYIYDIQKRLICTNNRNNVIMGKSCKELQEGGYDAFINNYYCFDKDILNKREKLVTKGEEFTTKVLFKNRNGDYEKYLVTNKVFIRDEYNQPVLFLGESISLENLFDNDSEINEMYSKDRVYRHLNFVKQFSERQREVLYLVFYEGLSDQEIADKLHISLDTVCSHKKDIKNKIKVSSNTQFNKILRKNLLPELN